MSSGEGGFRDRDRTDVLSLSSGHGCIVEEGGGRIGGLKVVVGVRMRVWYREGKTLVDGEDWERGRWEREEEVPGKYKSYEWVNTKICKKNCDRRW